MPIKFQYITFLYVFLFWTMYTLCWIGGRSGNIFYYPKIKIPFYDIITQQQDTIIVF